VHKFRIERENGRISLRHIGSSYPPPPFEPSIDRAVLGCYQTATRDGGFVLNFRTPYWISKWDADGNLEWERKHSEVLPSATDYFRLSPIGRAEIGEFPRSSSVVELRNDLYLHVMSFPDPQNANRDPTDWEYYAKYELLEVSNAEVIGVYSLAARPFEYSFSAVDSLGRLLGVRYRDGEAIPLRYTPTIERAQRQ